MASLAETRKSTSLLLGDIHKHLLSEHGKPTDRRQDIIHPSEMAKSDWCPRQTYYRLAGASPEKDRNFSAQLEGVFAEGHMIHAKWQKWLQDMGRLYGKWVCRVCGYSWIGTGGHPTCEECYNALDGYGDANRFALEYHEVPLAAEEKYLIAGHEDGAVEDLNALVEIKSIGNGTVRFDDPKLLRQFTVKTEDGKTVIDTDGLWKALRRPFGSHIRQTQIYLALCKEMGLPFDQVIFLYEYKATQATKEFAVKYNPEISEPLLDSALDIKYALSKGKPPPRPDFTGQDTKVCKECPFFNTCWETTTDDASGSKEGLGRRADAQPEGDEEAGTRGPVPASEAGGRRARTAGGSHRAKRRRTDEPVRADDLMGGVHGSPAGSSGGGRKVVRRHTRST
jgi:CRISPR/Cas system-associated exonuclease Cas4 (RecB family)